MEQNGWRQPIRYLVVLSIFLASIWFVVVARPLISSLVVAALVAYILHPFVNLIIRHTRLSYNMAVNITYLLFLSVLVAIPAILTPFVIRQVSGVTVDVEYFLQQIRILMNRPLAIGSISISLENVVSSLEALLTETTTFIAGNAVSTLRDVSTNFLWILVILVSIYYLLRDSHDLVDWLLAPISGIYQHHARRLLAEIDDIWGNFLRGQLLLMIFVGILSWLGGGIVGLPGAFVVGLIAGILDLIPSLGPTLAAVIAVAIAFLEGSTYLPISNFWFSLIVLAVFIVIQQIENIWIRPVLMGRRLHLHPALVFIGVFGSLALFGILAALVIIPVMSSIGVIGRYILCRIRGINPYPELTPTYSESETTTELNEIIKMENRLESDVVEQIGN